MAEWGERQPDGSVIVRNDEGRPERQESWAQNQGQGASSNVGANPATFGPAIELADRNAMMAYNNARLALDRELGVMRNEREKERIALEAARDAWNKTYQTASLSGYMPNAAQGKGQAVMDALGQLRSNAQYQAADGDVKRQMEAAAVSQATGIDTASAAQAIDRLRGLTATTGQPSSAALVEQVLGQTPGGGGVATLDREREQNRAAIDALTLLSNLRGPENAFAYASTLQNLPPAIRANIQAAMGRMPFTAQNPAQRGVLGDVGALPMGPAFPGQAIGGIPVGGQPAPGTSAFPVTQPPLPGAYPGAGSWPALQAGGRTLAGGGTVNPYLPAPVDTSPAGQMAQQAAQGAYQGATQTTQPALQAGGRTLAGGGTVNQYLPAPVDTSPAGQMAAGAAQGAYQGAQPQAAPGSLMAQGWTSGPGGQEMMRSPSSWSGAQWQPAYGPRTAPAVAAGMQAPSQWSPTAWNQTGDYARRLTLGAYEWAGEDPREVMDQYKRSLPLATGPRVGRYRGV
jgi:hypothetical protein